MKTSASYDESEEESPKKHSALILTGIGKL